MKKFSLRAKILTLSISLVAMSIVLSGIFYWNLRSVVDKYAVIANVNYPNTSSMLQMFSNYRYSRIQVLTLASPVATPELKKTALEIIDKSLAKDQELHKLYMAIPFQPGEAAIYEGYRKVLDEGFGDIKKVADLFKENKGDANLQAINKIVYVDLEELGSRGRASVENLQNFHFTAAEKSQVTAEASVSYAIKLIVALICIMGMAGLVTAYLFSNSLAKALKEISDALDQSSTQVSAAASQIASSSEELSQAATEQAASLEETSSSVEEMSSMTSINAENARKASENSMGSQKQAERGRQVVTEMVHSMSQINDSNNNIMNQINSSNEQMTEIIKVIQEIETKTKVINDIVFQTKLLSFNASVEAARAGDQGKGFAVVAEEVGNLAQMSGNAAKEISDMLASSIHKVEGIVNETKSKVEVLIADGKEKVKAGTKVAEECGEVLAEIVTNVSNVTTMASEISNASVEQSKGIQEITKAMGQLDQVTQTNSATSEEAASAAEELSAQADSLKNQVLTLVAVINGTAAPVAVTNASTNNHHKPKKMHTTANVIPMKKPEVKMGAKPSAKGMTASVSAPVKKTAGGNGLPSYDHPGFEDV